MANEVLIEQPRASGCSEKVHRWVFGLFLAQFALVWVRLWLPRPAVYEAGWPEAALLLLAAATLLASLARNLPWQNVLLAAATVALMAIAATVLGRWLGIPFGPFAYTGKSGQLLFDELPGAVAAIWIIFLLSSRGTARLVLRPWRDAKNYGFWVIGLTAGLTVWLDFSFEPFASQLTSYWRWPENPGVFNWYGAPGGNFLAWLATALLILAFATPSLINKKPVPPPPPEYIPLVVWLLLNLLFATGCALHHRVLPATLIFVTAAIAGACALSGARRGGATIARP